MSPRSCSDRRATRLAGLVLLAALSAAQAQSGGTFAIPRSVVAAGGGSSTGGTFELRGTAGQAEANPAPASGGAFEVRGGFWRPGTTTPPPDDLFGDGFEP